MNQTSPGLSWETDIRLMTHPLMLANFAKLLAISGFIMAALLSGLMLVTGSADAIPGILELTGVCLAGVAVLFVLVSLLFFRNRMHMRFTLDGSGAAAQMIDRRALAANKVAIIAGVLTGKPGVAGAGLMADANTQQHVSWNAVAKAHYHPSWGAISLANSWRTVVTLYCTAENYAGVAAAVESALAARPAAAKAAKKSPLPMLLLRTLLTVVACIPLFGMPDLDEGAILPALLTLCFALAALWLIPVLGFVVFAGLGWITALELLEQSRMRTSMFDASHFSGWDVLSGDEQAVLVLAAIGAAYLIWQTVGLIRGKVRAGLFGDEAESDEA